MNYAAVLRGRRRKNQDLLIVRKADCSVFRKLQGWCLALAFKVSHLVCLIDDDDGKAKFHANLPAGIAAKSRRDRKRA